GRDPQRVVAGIAGAAVLEDSTENGAGQNRAITCESGERLRAVAAILVDVALNAQMRSLRAEIADCHSQIRSDLALYVQVPGLDIGVLEILINRGWGQSNSGGVAQRAGESGESQCWIGRLWSKSSWVS